MKSHLSSLFLFFYVALVIRVHRDLRGPLGILTIRLRCYFLGLVNGPPFRQNTIVEVIRRQPQIVDVFHPTLWPSYPRCQNPDKQDHATGLTHHACWPLFRGPPLETSYYPALPSLSTYRPV